jgi:hypothetical protein
VAYTYRRWVETLWQKKFSSPYLRLVFGARQTGIVRQPWAAGNVGAKIYERLLL